MKKVPTVCRDCLEHYDRKDLSNSGLCYHCARMKMLQWFDISWSLKHKREVKNEGTTNL